jgi:hypothetical protein
MEFLRSGSSDMHIEAGPADRAHSFSLRQRNVRPLGQYPLRKDQADRDGNGGALRQGRDADEVQGHRLDRQGSRAARRPDGRGRASLRLAADALRAVDRAAIAAKPIRDINAVGFLPQQIADLKAAYSQNRGILIVTGATGSGKTNTLESIYAQLEEADSKKIIEIGEPIEIRSTRRTQMSLRPNSQFTWWDAFYSCLRADPDIIGIGELRSAEHAAVAINAALTGHLVLSTFHAANVEDTLSRMFQLGLPRENLSTGLNLILAQSLIKKLCERCKIVDPHPSEIYEREVYKSVGCPDCFHKGTRGRTAMAELLYFNDEVKEWVEDRNLTARDVVQRATRAGYLIPMKTVAREKVPAGHHFGGRGRRRARPGREQASVHEPFVPGNR